MTRLWRAHLKARGWNIASAWQRRALLLCGGIAAVLLAAAPASALLVQPLVLRMETSGPGASAAISVVNDRNRANTIELKLSRVTLGETGAPQLTPDNGDDFLIFPPIATVQPGRTQVFRIRWIGADRLDRARPYMITTQEVPVDQAGSGVQVVYAIQSLVSLRSPGMESAVEAVSLTRASREPAAAPAATATAPSSDKSPMPATAPAAAQPEQGVELVVANTGTDNLFLSDYALRLSGPGGWKAELSQGAVERAVGLGFVPAGGRRRLFLPVAQVPEGALQVVFRRAGAR